MSLSASKVIRKATTKRKIDGKDDRPPKKIAITPSDKHPKKSAPLKPNNGAGKGLMTTFGPITQGPDRYLLTHKDYTIKVMEYILKGKEIDPYAEQATEELGSLGLF